MGPRFVIALFFIVLTVSCINSDVPESKEDKKTVTVWILPLKGLQPQLAEHVVQQVRAYFPLARLLPAAEIPSSCGPFRGKRYSADSLLIFLKQQVADSGAHVLALTTNDIFTTKANNSYWGVMGLGYCPGKVCVASGFRLNQSKLSRQLAKVALHELGHTFGLKHCAINTCFMRDAKGKNHCDEEIGFCNSCAEALGVSN